MKIYNELRSPAHPFIEDMPQLAAKLSAVSFL
jgi:hypothetical protein